MRFDKFLNEKIEKYKIFLDMDGVIVDFIKQADEFFGAKSWDQWKEMKKSHWSKVSAYGEKFWSEMDWLPDGQKLWNYLESKYKDIQILTAHPLDKGGAEIGKRNWLIKNINHNIAANAIICMGRDKQTYAAPNHILIDDSERNIRQWRNRGGIGIFHKNTNSTIKQLKRL